MDLKKEIVEELLDAINYDIFECLKILLTEKRLLKFTPEQFRKLYILFVKHKIYNKSIAKIIKQYE